MTARIDRRAFLLLTGAASATAVGIGGNATAAAPVGPRARKTTTTGATTTTVAPTTTTLAPAGGGFAAAFPAIF